MTDDNTVAEMTAEQEAADLAARVQVKRTEARKGKKPAKRGRGRPKGTGPKQRRQEIEDTRAFNEEAALMAPGPDKLAAPAFAPPAQEEEKKPPAAQSWPLGIIKLWKRNGIMFEDFGMSRGQVTMYAERAAQGGAGSDAAQRKLEPLRQATLEMMGLDKHWRPIQIRDPQKPDRLTYKTKPDPTDPTGRRRIIATEERSRWGVREGSDMVGNRGKRPRPAAYYHMVNDHFYTLVTLIEPLTKVPAIPQHPNMPRHKAEAVREDHAIKLSAATNPMRAMWLEILRPIIKEGASTRWGGKD